MGGNDGFELLNTFKVLLNGVLLSSKLTKGIIGTVTAINPVTVKIGSKIELREPMVVVPRHLTDYEVRLSIDLAKGSELGGVTKKEEEPLGHVHGLDSFFVRETKATIFNALRVGDRVILIQNHGGSEYIIFDRMVD